MRRLNNARLILIGLMVIFGVIPRTQAQDEDSIWYWAWRSYDLEVEDPEDQAGDLLAFTPDGTMNVLLENVFPVVLERIDENEAFVGSRRDDTYYLYYITSVQAVEVVELFDQSYVDEWYQNAIYEGYSYFMPEIIVAGENRYLIADRKHDQYIIFDTMESTTFTVDLRPWCNDDCMRVSVDGRFIRYRVSQTDPIQSSVFFDPGENALPYQLYEYDTFTQTEHLFHEQPALDLVGEGGSPPRGDCTPDETGRLWYCELFLDDGSNPTWTADDKYIVDTSGSIEPINQDWQLRLLNDRWYFLDLDRRRTGCDPCIIHVFPDGDETAAFQFVVPPIEDFAFWYDEVQMLSEQHLLPNPTGLPMYALSRSGELTELGMRPCCSDPVSMDYYDEETGWMIMWRTVALNGVSTDETVIWQTRPLNQVAVLPVILETGTRGTTFRDYSLVLAGALYSYFDNAVYEPNFDTAMIPMDAFPGGILLYDPGYADSFTMQAEDDGIYRWTPEDGLILVINGAAPVPLLFY